MHYCFLIDGLDECQPESAHTRLMSTLETIASYERVKIIVSSRSWSVFEQKLTNDKWKLTVEEVNRDSITNYIRDRVEDVTSAHVLSDIDWQTVKWLQACSGEHDRRHCPRSHSRGQMLVEDIVRKAEGVFLWTALVMDELCPRLAAGRSLNELCRHVKDFPAELEAYFQAQVDRIDKAWRSEMLMAFRLATLRSRQDLWFVMLANDFGLEESPLLSPDFPFDMAAQEFDASTKWAMWQKTCDLLHYCAQDILIVHSNAGPGDDWCSSGHSITFTHRAALDFLQTPTMKTMIDRETPSHFQTADLESRLAVAQLKCAPEEKGRFSDLRGWEVLVSFFSRSPAHPPSAALIAEAELAAIHRASNVPLFAKDPDDYAVETLFRVCSSFASVGLYDFIALALQRSPEAFFLNSEETNLMWYAVGAGHSVSRRRTAVPEKLDKILLSLLLAHGVDPNLTQQLTIRTKTGGYQRDVSPWTAFLGRLLFNEATIESAASVPGVAEDAINIDATATSGLAGTSELFSDPDVQAAIMDFLAYGADLNADVQALLNAADLGRPLECEPMSAIEILQLLLPEEYDGMNRETLLDEYCRPEEKEEIRMRRQELVEKWAR